MTEDESKDLVVMRGMLFGFLLCIPVNTVLLALGYMLWKLVN